MTVGSEAIKVAKPVVGGGVFVAPLGTELPTDYDTPLDSAFKPLGYVSEDGVTRTEENESEDKIAWGGDAVADLPGNHTLSFSATFLEGRNAETLKALRGEENVTVGSDGSITVTSNSKRPPRAVYVIDTESVREVIPNAQIAVSGDIQYVHNEVIQYEASWKAYPDASGNKAKQYFPADGEGDSGDEGDESGEG